MGRLVKFEDLNEEISWYISDDCYELIDYHRHLKWPNPCFPECVAIKVDILWDKNIKIEIRKWIERAIHDTVITKPVDKSYRVYYGDKKPPFTYGTPGDMWEKSFEVNNRWLAFYFEDKESALAFKLRFGDIVSEIIEREPEHLDKITENHGR